MRLKVSCLSALPSTWSKAFSYSLNSSVTGRGSGALVGSESWTVAMATENGKEGWFQEYEGTKLLIRAEGGRGVDVRCGAVWHAGKERHQGAGKS